MSSGRKVTVTLTQAEAQAVVSCFRRYVIGEGMTPDMLALDRGAMKIQHQLNAVRGKVSA